MAAIDEYIHLCDHDWTVRAYGEWLLVCDSATRYWVRPEDVTDAALEVWRQTQDYTALCREIPGHQDSDVPPDVVELAAEDLDLETPIACGW